MPTALTCEQLKARLASLPQDTLVVGLFINFANVSQDEWLNPLAGYLRKHGYVTIGLMTERSAAKCKLDQATVCALVTPAEVAELDRINVFLISDMDHSGADFPQSSSLLGVWHSFDLASDSALPLSASYAALLDAWLCPYPFSLEAQKNIRDLWTGLVSREASPRHGQQMRLIPCGSPRMAVLEKKLEKLSQKPDAILFAPIRINYALERGGRRLVEHGAKTINCLLEHFSAQKIIFRPYREDLDSAVVAAICAVFACNPRFELDTAPDRLPSFARGQLLVTDFSHVGLSFAFATQRPVIYFEPWSNGQKIQDVWRSFACTYRELVEQVNYCLKNANQIGAQIRALLAKEAMPFSQTFAKIAAVIQTVAKQKTEPGWITIERPPQAVLPPATQIIKKIVAQPRQAWPALSLTAATYGRPQSLLLAAFTLHNHLAQTPQRLIFHPFRLLLARMLNGEFYRYADVAAEQVRQLYCQASRQAERSGDLPARQMAEALLKNFNAQF